MWAQLLVASEVFFFYPRFYFSDHRKRRKDRIISTFPNPPSPPGLQQILLLSLCLLFFSSYSSSNSTFFLLLESVLRHAIANKTYTTRPAKDPQCYQEKGLDYLTVRVIRSIGVVILITAYFFCSFRFKKKSSFFKNSHFQAVEEFFIFDGPETVVCYMTSLRVSSDGILSFRKCTARQCWKEKRGYIASYVFLSIARCSQLSGKKKPLRMLGALIYRSSLQELVPRFGRRKPGLREQESGRPTIYDHQMAGDAH